MDVRKKQVQHRTLADKYQVGGTSDVANNKAIALLRHNNPQNLRSLIHVNALIFLKTP